MPLQNSRRSRPLKMTKVTKLIEKYQVNQPAVKNDTCDYCHTYTWTSWNAVIPVLRSCASPGQARRRPGP